MTPSAWRPELVEVDYAGRQFGVQPHPIITRSGRQRKFVWLKEASRRFRMLKFPGAAVCSNRLAPAPRASHTAASPVVHSRTWRMR